MKFRSIARTHPRERSGCCTGHGGWRGLRRWTFRLLLLALLLFGTAWAVLPFHRSRIDHLGKSVRVADREGGVLRELAAPQGLRLHPLQTLPEHAWISRALIATEDKRFYQHPGVDPLAIMRATGQNMASRRVISGASTLSTQLMRLTAPNRRTLSVKVAEAFRALQMEQLYSKDEILLQYLNRAPFGGRLVGVETASRQYFGKSAMDLTLGEASLLAGLPQAPSRFRPDRYLDRALVRRTYVLDRMEVLGMISARERELAEGQSLPIRSQDSPFAAPHFCDLLVQQCPEAIAQARQGTGMLQSSLDPILQAEAEQIITEASGVLAMEGMYGMAAVVLSVTNGAVRALVGSPDFFDTEQAGQVNLAWRPRSAGSTLKPFLYALAADRGICSPDTMLSDAPRHYRGYEPENFDRGFRGRVAARDALADSLNMPALQLTEQVGLDRFYRLLNRLGLSTLRADPDHYGLSLALGTGEVRLLELANAYACLARLGKYLPYSLLESSEVPTGRQMFRPGACWMIADMLADPHRLVRLYGEGAGNEVPRAAWKTGTSNGYRDAWTVVYNPEYVVAVWVGNPDGQGHPGLVGSEAAAPVAGRLFRAVLGSHPAHWFDRPDPVVQARLCAASGSPVGSGCTAFLNGPLLSPVSVERRCRLCAGTGQAVAVQANPPPRILVPAPGEEYIHLPRAHGIRQGLLLRARAEGTLHWYIDGRYLDSSDAGAPIHWNIEPGSHVIACCDEQGREDKVHIRVNGGI